MAERAKLAASLNNQERVGWDCPTRSIAALATANWQPYQNFALPEAHGTRTVFHWLPCTEYADIKAPPGIERRLKIGIWKLVVECGAYSKS